MANETITLGVRLPLTLKEKLALVADQNLRSLNGEVTYRLEESFRPTTKIIEAIFEAIDFEKIQRIRSSSTSTDVSRILTIIRNFDIERIILGARKDNLNNAALVMVVQTHNVTFLIDATDLNMARVPREAEIQEIFREIDRLGLLTTIDYCEKYIPETKQLLPNDALKTILTKGAIHKLSNIGDFLEILSLKGRFDVKKYLFS